MPFLSSYSYVGTSQEDGAPTQIRGKEEDGNDVTMMKVSRICIAPIHNLSSTTSMTEML